MRLGPLPCAEAAVKVATGEDSVDCLFFIDAGEWVARNVAVAAAAAAAAAACGVLYIPTARVRRARNRAEQRERRNRAVQEARVVLEPRRIASKRTRHWILQSEDVCGERGGGASAIQ